MRCSLFLSFAWHFSSSTWLVTLPSFDFLHFPSFVALEPICFWSRMWATLAYTSINSVFWTYCCQSWDIKFEMSIHAANFIGLTISSSVLQLHALRLGLLDYFLYFLLPEDVCLPHTCESIASWCCTNSCYSTIMLRTVVNGPVENFTQFVLHNMHSLACKYSTFNLTPSHTYNMHGSRHGASSVM